jgi:hypothetical protein
LFRRTFYDHQEEVEQMTTPDGAQPVEEQRVESVERALTVLEAFGRGDGPLSLNDLAKATGFLPQHDLAQGSLAAAHGLPRPRC